MFTEYLNPIYVQFLEIASLIENKASNSYMSLLLFVLNKVQKYEVLEYSRTMDSLTMSAMAV